MPAARLATMTPVSEHTHGPLITIERTATLREAARAMHTEGVGAIAVDGHPDLAGVFTERDLLAAIAAGADPDVELVGADMTSGVITVRPDDPVLDVALTMLDDGIRHVPVVDGFGKRSGMISLRDLTRPLVLQAMTPSSRPTRPQLLPD